MNLLLAGTIVKPEHSIADAIFWLLVFLTLLAAVTALKVLFQIADKEILRWRTNRTRKSANKTKGKKS